MFNIFDDLKVYNTPWTVKEIRNFTAEEKARVSSATVVPSEYGLSVKFSLNSGGYSYIPLSNSSSLTQGEAVNLNTAKIIILEKVGADDIKRIE